MRAGELADIALSYENSGIIDEPPGEVLHVAQRHKVIVCSDLPRSVQSAQALGADTIHSVEALFRETAIPYFSSGSIVLPMSVWIIVLRSLWLAGFSRNGESLLNAKLYARAATEMLIQLAYKHEKVLLVGHGFMNYFIAKELVSNAWAGPPRPGNGYWEYAVYRSYAPQRD